MITIELYKRIIMDQMFFSNTIKKVFLLLGLFLLFLHQGSAMAKDYDYINIRNPSHKKMPVAVSEFKAFNGSEIELNDGEEARRILSNALNFTGYLKTMNPAAFLANPAKTGIQLGQINFRDWTGIGAELLVTGGIIENNGKLTFRLRLIDTFNTKLLVGKIYTGPRKQLRKMIHLFCSEISHKLTGKWGVFRSQIAFVSTVKGNKEIFTCDFDGENIKQITHHKSICLSPSWSYDGKWLAYVSFAKKKPDIFIKNLKENRGVIINFKGMTISPDWMPGRLELAATLSFSGDQEIYLLTMKGKVIKRVTKSWGIDVSPKFSPDGENIAFTSKRAGSPQVYVKNIKTGIVKRLTFTGKYNTSPAWSPDGKKIAYAGIEDNKINIYVISVEGGMPAQLTQDSRDNEDPVWSPDGSMISFTSNRMGGISRVFVMAASGYDQRRLLKLKGKQSQPDWSLPKTKDN
jgi:TolB protein